MSVETHETELHRMVKQNPGFRRAYEAYQADLAMIERINAARPTAPLVVVCEHWCGDCRWPDAPHGPHRRVSAWVDRRGHALEWGDAQRALAGARYPTLVVLEGEREMGRIVENPRTGALEDDLRHIVGG